MKLKIVYIISSLQQCGPVNVLFNIVKNLDRESFIPIIITLSKEKDLSIKKHFIMQNVEVFSLNLPYGSGYIKGYSKLKEILKNLNPDIIHSHCFRSNILSALISDKYIKVATIHSDFMSDYSFCFGKFLGKIMGILNYIALIRIKNAICCSNYLSQKLLKRFNRKFMYINNGIDINTFCPTTNKIDLRRKLNLPIDKIIVIWSANIIALKNPIFYANIINKINSDEIYFLICGDGYLQEKVQDILKDNKNVILTGKVKNISEYLKSADFYVSTSQTEGLPLSVLEAMACGLPVILSDISPHKYIFGNDSKIPILFSTDNEKALLALLLNIKNFNRELLSKSVRDIVETTYSSELMSQNYQHTYLELKEHQCH